MALQTPLEACQHLYESVKNLYMILDKARTEESSLESLPVNISSMVTTALDDQHLQSSMFIQMLRSADQLDREEAIIIRKVFALEDIVRTMLSKSAPTTSDEKEISPE